MKCSSEQELSGLNFPQTDTFLWCILFKPCFSNSRSWEVTVAQERTLPQWQASQGVGFPSKAHVQQSHHIGMCRILNVLFLFLSTHCMQERVTWTHHHEAFLSERDLFKRAEPVHGARECEMEDRLRAQDSDSSGLSQSLSCCLSFVFQ